MEPELEPMLPPETRASAPVPLWVWALMVVLAGATVYAGYTALSAQQLYAEGERVRSDLAQQRDRLKANVTDLTRQVEQANKSRDELDNSLKQSRANTEAASAQIADLQKQIADQAQRITDLEKARDAAEASAKTAQEAGANAAAEATAKVEKDVASLKAQLAASQKKLAQAQADLKKEREQVSPVPMPPPAAAPPPQ